MILISNSIRHNCHCKLFQSLHNKSLPKWVETKIGNMTALEKLNELKPLEFDWKFANEAASKFRGGPLLKDMVENMKMFIKEPASLAGLRMVVYSSVGHGSSLMILLDIRNYVKRIRHMYLCMSYLLHSNISAQFWRAALHWLGAQYKNMKILNFSFSPFCKFWSFRLQLGFRSKLVQYWISLESVKY